MIHSLRFGGMAVAMLAASPPLAALNYEVYPGSAFYLDQMLDRTAWSFVATHASGLYHHPVGFSDLSDAQESLYTGHFTNRFAMVEGDMGSGSTTGDVANLQRMHALGLTPVAAFVNRPSTNLAVWRQLVRNNAAQGAPTYEMLAPHRLDDSPLGWYDPIRDYARANMLVAGCIGSGVDAPVYLYVHEGPAYRQTIYDLRDWSVANGKRFNYLVSPNNSYNAALLDDTRFLVRDLEDTGHEPDVYGVVLYGERPVDLTPEKIAVNGVDQAAATITGLAYYLIKHRDGEPGTLDLSALRQGVDHGAGATSPVLASPAQTVTLPPTATSTWTIRMANTSPWLDYAGVLRARVHGATGDWSVSFTSAGQDVSAAVLSDVGRKFLGGERWQPATTRTIEMTVAPLRPSPGTFKLVLEALPHGAIDHALDVISFEHGAHGNTPPTLAIEARPRVTRQELPLGPFWFTCGDAETASTALTVSAVSSNPTLVPAANLAFGQSGIQRWLRIVPAAGQWGEAQIAVTVSDGNLTTVRSFPVVVERTTILPVVKANNVVDLQNAPSWQNGATPGLMDQGVWDATVTSANHTLVSSPLSIGGLRVTNPGGPVSIQASAPLTLGLAGVDLSSAARDLTLSGGVILDEAATWNMATNRLVTAADGLSGPGGLTKSGNGRLVLSGQDSFVGPLAVNGGELDKSGAGAQSSTSVSNNAVLRVSHAGGFGTGGLSVSAANSSTGRVEISGGISVLAGRSITLNSRTSNTDAIVSNGNNTLAGNLSISTGGSLCAIASNSGMLTASGSISSIATGSRTLTVRGAADGRLTGTISNGSGTVGITKDGAGTWWLEGTHSFTGPVTISQGTLVINQALPQQQVSVASGAMLAGTAPLGGDVTVAGTHSPGNPVGSQTLAGNLTYSPGAVILWQIGSQSATADRIQAATVAIDTTVRIDVMANPPGGNVNFSDPFWSVPRQWPVVEAAVVNGAPALGSVSADAGGRPVAPFGKFAVNASAGLISLAWTPGDPYDRWLYQHFSASWDDPQVAGPGRDPDGDGWTNRDEWISATLPADPSSRFTIAATGNGVSFTRAAGRVYQVQTATAPGGPWSHHATAPAGDGPVSIPGVADPGPRRFYRVLITLPPAA